MRRPRAQGLQRGFLGGEARRQMRDGIVPPLAVGDLRLGEDAVEEAILPALDHLPHPGILRQVHPDAADGLVGLAGNGQAHWPIACRMIPASSWAIFSISACSSPFHHDARRSSVPE